LRRRRPALFTALERGRLRSRPGAASSVKLWWPAANPDAPTPFRHKATSRSCSTRKRPHARSFAHGRGWAIKITRQAAPQRGTSDVMRDVPLRRSFHLVELSQSRLARFQSRPAPRSHLDDAVSRRRHARDDGA
jgi:hypothetical protein